MDSILTTAALLKGGWKDKDKKVDCLAQGFLSQDIDQYSKLPFALTMEARDVADKMGRVLSGTHTRSTQRYNSATDVQHTDGLKCQ
eukprot:COSAG02_NODE_2448_length_8837_cov_38.266880_6_plen_86_part_00